MKLLGVLLCGITMATATLRDSSPEIIPIPGGFNGIGVSSHYWDCCVPACSYPLNMLGVTHGVDYCLVDGETKVSDYTGQPGCISPSGTTYTCNDNQPWIVNDTLAFGFTSAPIISGGLITDNCCQCVLLSFQGPLLGKHYLAQITNTGSDKFSSFFDIQIPGGGVGKFNGCQTQWDAGPDGWGTRYGGVSSAEECSKLPEVLQEGCRFRWTFLEGVEQPPVTYQQVQCPKELTRRTGCQNVNDL